jgi:ATP-dependent DNA helicase RecG
MALSLTTDVRMIKGVGPQRAELLAKRGIHTFEDLLAYLPFRYEDRIHFSNIKDIQPNDTYTIRARVMSGQAIPNKFSPNAIYHLLVQDAAGGLLPCKFFHGGYLEGRLKPGQQLVLHGKVEIDKLRPARLEMINPQLEMLGNDEPDSTEVGRIVPIYEAIGTFGSRAIRRAMYAAVQLLDSNMPDILPEALRARLGYPSRRESLIHVHFRARRIPRSPQHFPHSRAATPHLRKFFSISSAWRSTAKPRARKTPSPSVSAKKSPRGAQTSFPSSPPPRRSAFSQKLPPTSKSPLP